MRCTREQHAERIGEREEFKAEKLQLQAERMQDSLEETIDLTSRDIDHAVPDMHDVEEANRKALKPLQHQYSTFSEAAARAKDDYNSLLSRSQLSSLSQYRDTQWYVPVPVVIAICSASLVMVVKIATLRDRRCMSADASAQEYFLAA